MTETQKRIKAYKELLPGMRERVIAVALLLVISVAMLTSVSFAWVTLSKSPEVTGASTTLAANGNLEIALAGSSGTAPGESQVGDSSASENQTVTGANLTWGNLINLSDDSYGLSNLVLRPAQLNQASLLLSPLYGAEYDADGRITNLTSKFSYTSWVEPDGDTPGYFGLATGYGVRAISSVSVTVVGGQETVTKFRDNAEMHHLLAASAYSSLMDNDSYMSTLATLMGTYMTYNMSQSGQSETYTNPTVEIEDLCNLRDLYKGFLECYEHEANAMAQLITYQLYMINTNDYILYTGDMVWETSAAKLKTLGQTDAGKYVVIEGIDQFIKDRNVIASDYEALKTLCESGTDLKWVDSGINQIVDHLVNVGTCTIGEGDDAVTIDSIGASNAASYITGTQQARITNGILLRFEQRIGTYMDKILSINAKVMRSGFPVSAYVKAQIQTTADRSYTDFATDQAYADSFLEGGFQGGVETAQDTYGMAIDFYVRTNAADSILTLTGNVLTTTETVRSTGTDLEGTEVDLYTLTITYTDEDSKESYSIDYTVYLVASTDSDGNTVKTYYNIETYSVVTIPEDATFSVAERWEERVTITGYEGENRVWDGKTYSYLDVDATTQGNGSCYVFYANTPEDQAQAMKLVSALKVAFVNRDSGKLLATAEMDVDSAYADNGRITVPLTVVSGVSYTDDDGNTCYGIMELNQNQATPITAIVYLDGTKLGNEDVLASSDIQGQLNIQFGTTVALNSIENEDLSSQTMSVSASIDNTKFDYDTHEGDMTTNVTLDITGTEPSKVTAFFIRQISSTQGTREETMTFTKGEDGKWTASYTFDSPGTYVLRTVTIDGQERVLSETPTVTVEGFTISSLTCTQATGRTITVMSADSTYNVDLSLTFATNDSSKLPKTVQGVFYSDNGSITVNFTAQSDGTWKGNTTFRRSDTYTMTYLILDGNYNTLPSSLCLTANITLGMQVKVWTNSPQKITYTANMAENEKKLAMKVKIYDNSGNELKGLTDVKLTYAMRGQSNKTTDGNLTWNGTYYVGDMPNVGAGIWVFKNVTVGSNTLTYASISPTFTIIPPEPPAYEWATNDATQVNLDGSATLKVTMSNASAATVQAYIVKQGTTEGTWVAGTSNTVDGYTTFYFTIPADASGSQEGTWQITQLKAWDVYDENEMFYDSETMDPATNGYEIEFDGTIQTKVISSVTLTMGSDVEVKTKSDGSAYAFLETGSFSGLTMTVTDKDGNALVDDNGVQVGNITVTLEYVNGSSATYGGYTGDGLTNATVGTITLTLTDSGDGKTFVQDGSQTLTYAGEYQVTKVEFTVASKSLTYEGTSGSYKLPSAQSVYYYTAAPTLKVTAISPTTSTSLIVNSADNPTAGNFTKLSGVYNYLSSDGYFATAYIYYEEEWLGVTYYNASLPTVTLTLSDVSNNFASAAVTFSNASYSDAAKTYSFTPSAKSASNTIGYYVNRTGTDYEIYPAGEQAVSQIAVTTSDGMTITANLSHSVTINQPQYPPYVTFSSIFDADNSYTGTQPSTVYSTDGKTVVLPSFDNVWTYANAVAQTATDPTETKTKDGSYYYKKSTLNYSYYTRYKYTSTLIAKSDVYKVTKKVQWLINGTVYDPGDTVTLAEAAVATPYITTVSNTYLRTATTTTVKTWYQYEIGSWNRDNSLSSDVTVGTKYDYSETITEN